VGTAMSVDDSSSSTLFDMAKKGKEIRSDNELQSAKLEAKMSEMIEKYYPLELLEVSVNEKINEVSKSMKNATDLLRKFDGDRLAFENELKLQHPDIAAVERALFALFWENPNNPTKLNQVLARLKDKLQK
jgi:hypothetical protein